MSDFKAKVHLIRFRLGLHPRPLWGSLQRSPRPSSWIEVGLLLKGERGEEEKERDGTGREGTGGKSKGRGKGGEGKGLPLF